MQIRLFFKIILISQCAGKLPSLCKKRWVSYDRSLLVLYAVLDNDGTLPYIPQGYDYTNIKYCCHSVLCILNRIVKCTFYLSFKINFQEPHSKLTSYGYTVYPKKYAHVFCLLCFVVVIHWLIFPYPSSLLHWHCGNLTIAPVPAKQPWWIWINTSCEFIMNDCITTTKQSTTKPCAYFLGYTVTYAAIARYLGAVSIRKTVLPGMAIPMLKIRRHNGRLIFNMEIAIRR